MITFLTLFSLLLASVPITIVFSDVEPVTAALSPIAILPVASDLASVVV